MNNSVVNPILPGGGGVIVYQGKVIATSRQSQGTVKATSREGQGKVKPSLR